MSPIEQSVSVAIDRRVPIALLLAFLLHNLEECLTFSAYREASQALVRNLTSANFAAPSSDSFFTALAIVSLAAAVSMTWAILQPTRHSAFVLVEGLAWMMLLNVFLPHVPASILLGGYAPGVVTAIFVNLPVAGFILVRLRSTRSQ